jgi:Carboxypeptidase regulatory-like domain/Fn3 associated/Chitobiase/beta-hexosaminidase C-terminal domain
LRCVLKLGAWFLKIAFIVAFVVLIARPVEASPVQVGSTGSVTGQVVDPSGAVVPGAAVTVTNDSNGQSATATTDAAGNFTVGNFPVGSASIKVTAAGFHVVQVKGLTISVGQALTQHIVLPVGAESEEVLVTSAEGGTPAPGSNPEGAQKQAAATQQQHSQGQQLTGSAWGTPDACATGTAGALAAKGILFVHRSLVLPQEATDDFGYRLGKRFLVYQVTVTNAATDFQYALSDIVVDLKPILTRLNAPLLQADATGVPTPAAYQASSQDLSMLRGVPEKGQDYDPRNMTLHILQGIGAVGAAVSGLTPFSDVMGSAMANFNGAFLQAFTGIAPDHTATQLNRLSDKAFTSNTLIGKLQTKTFAIFIPEQFVMPKGDQKNYWKDPRALLTKLPFDQLNVCVDGILLVQAATTPDPTFSTTESLVAPNATIALADGAAGATIYYTTNGDTPTTSSAKYSTPIAVGAAGTAAVTIKAFAIAPNQSPSNTVVGTFTPATAASTPTFTCSADNKSVTLAPATPKDIVFYTTDGTAPSRSSSSITASTTVSFSSTSQPIQAFEVGNATSRSSVVPKTCP